MYISQFVHALYREHHLGDVELGHVLGQAVLELGQQREQVAAAVVIHYQVLCGKKMTIKLNVFFILFLLLQKTSI